MGRTLKDQIAYDVAATAFDTDEFAENVTFSPGGGGADRTISVLIDDAVAAIRIGEMVAEDERNISVMIGKDQTATVGGLTTPAKGDRITRSDGRVYGWTGEISGETVAFWDLEYRYYELSGTGSQVRRG